MSRRDDHLDAMLRHLGAAYYESLHGRAGAADVARARAAVEERLAEQPAASVRPPAGHEHEDGAPGSGPHRHGRWHNRVRDVMTTNVVTVDRITTYKEIAALLAKHRISAVPVLAMGRRVVGVVSEDDLLTAQDTAARQAARPALPAWRSRRERQHARRTASELMTAPAITIHPDAPVGRAARLMHDHHIKRLPVVDAEGTLIGIVSRRDLLSVFLRPDALIAQEVRDLMAEILFADPQAVSVTVHGGVVTLSSPPGRAEQRDLVPVAIRLIWDIDGVVDVVHKLSDVATATA